MAGRMVTAASAAAVCACSVLLSSCAFYHAHTPFHGRAGKTGCTEKPFAGYSESRPPLQAPAGLSAPDTRNAVKIPTLTSQERTRAATEPCLAQPPPFGNYVARPMARPLVANPPGAPPSAPTPDATPAGLPPLPPPPPAAPQ